MSYTERLAKQLDEASVRVTINTQKKVYDWNKESNQKRSVR